ncbi:pyrimidine/purine nucleosidase domain-containing protein [Escherichia coli]|nr:pyrimidine/purine nucleosidase domain-containing protein [Escherichia coli]
MITHISPLGSMDMLSQLEVDMLKRTASSDLYQLFRNCSLAVLNSGSLTDNSKELLSRFENFDINVLRRERGVKLELINPPEEAFVDGRIIRALQANLFAVLRDILFVYGQIHNTVRFPNLNLDNSVHITNLVFSILRNARALHVGEAPNMVVCWGGHSINENEYLYARRVGNQLGLRELNICTGCGPGAMEAPMKGAALETLSLDTASATGNGLWMTLWLAIPVMVFSFNHSPIISSFAVAKREEYGDMAEQKCSKILAFAHIMMVLTVMFFVFSCVLSLTPADLAAAKEQNISILSYLANHFNAPVIAWMAPIIAIIAITKSFLGHYLGAREGFNGMVIKSLRGKGKSIEINKLNRITALFMLVTTWIVATLNPSILGMIETLGGPIIAMILFLMPMYAIQKVPAMRKYSGHISNVFVVVMGLIAISAIFYSLFS